MSEKPVEERASDLRITLRQMALRNLRIALALRPRLLQLKEELGYSPQMSAEEYLTWKELKAGEVTDGIEQLLKDHNIPRYQFPIINWLYEASEADIAELKAYCKKPIGKPLRAYYLLYAPAYQFGSPTSPVWGQDTGYRVAALTREKAGYWCISGDLRGLPGELWWSILQRAGDFVVRGNLEVFDIDSWRRVGKLLGALKKEKHMGGKLGLVAGGQTGRAKARKLVMQDMTWADLQNIVAQDPRQYNRLCNKYASTRQNDFEDRYKAKYGGLSPSMRVQREVRRRAIKNFIVHVKKVR